MNEKLLDIIVCPHCDDPQRLRIEDDQWYCSVCGRGDRVIQHKPVLCSISSDEVSNSPPHAPGTGTFWRKKNWEFAQRFSRDISPDQVMLEVGTGRGYYKPLFPGSYIGTDVKLTSSVDFACNLVEQRAIRPSTLDMVLLSNVLEHVFGFDTLLRNTLIGLKPGGLLVVMVPWSGLHYVPHDYFRYTQWALAEIAKRHGLELVSLQGVYQPLIVVGNAFANLERSITGGTGVRNTLGRVAVRFTRRIMVDRVLAYLIRDYQPYGVVDDLYLDVDDDRNVSQLPLGYHAAYRKL